MINNVLLALTLACAIGSGLIAGMFYAFSTFVMRALGRIAPAEGIAAMQSINITVINPWFMAAFMGTAALSVLVVVLALLQWQSAPAIYLIAGAVLYLVGCFGVTIALNVPLNDALAAVEPASAEGASLWTKYLTEWTRWNSARTAGALAAMVSFMLALRGI